MVNQVLVCFERFATSGIKAAKTVACKNPDVHRGNELMRVGARQMRTKHEQVSALRTECGCLRVVKKAVIFALPPPPQPPVH